MMRHAAFFLSAAVLAFAQLAHADPPARAADAGGAAVCIGDNTKQLLHACPSQGATFDARAHVASGHVAVHFSPPATPKKADPLAKPNLPADSPEGRDDRALRLQARGVALLFQEINGLESLYEGTRANSPDRPMLARRLADDYVELESAAYRDKVKAETERDRVRRTNPALAGQAQATANRSAGMVTNARRRAEQYYDVIRTQFPTYAQLDEVLYYLAYEYEQASDNASARKVYYELIQKRPDSKYVPSAYLAFADLFFEEAVGDPTRWEYARDAYVKVIGYPPPGNRAYGQAWYKLGYVFWNTSDFDKALNAFKKAIDYGVAYPQVPNATKLAEAARRDIIPVYALKGDPSAAYNFFRAVSGDASGSSAGTFHMMDELGMSYLDTGHYPEAIRLYKDLAARDAGGDKGCVYQTHISEATMALRSGDKDAMNRELVVQLKAYGDYKRTRHAANLAAQCASATAALVTETAMAWHLEAVGSAGQRGTGDPKTMNLAAQLYDRVAKTWSREEFAGFSFPRLVKDDWPTLSRVKYARADLLYAAQHWAECGPAFDAVVDDDPRGPDAPEAAYTAALCYEKVYEGEHVRGEDRRSSGNLPGARIATSAADDDKLRPRELTAGERAMTTAFDRYACLIHPAANDVVGQAQLAEILFARARTYFEARHWEEAAEAFRDVAIGHAGTELGIPAAQLYLESANVLLAHATPPRASCEAEMAKDTPKLLNLYCTADKRAAHPADCDMLGRVESGLVRLGAQRKVETADKGAPNATALNEQAGNAYMEIWRTYCEAQLRAGEDAVAERCDEILYNAARAYQAAHLLGKAILARMVLLNPQYRLDKGELARKATYEIGKNYQAIAVYDQAADFFERYAALRPTPEKADVALSDAAVLRLGLGQEDAAIKDAQAFRARFGAAQPARTAALEYGIAAHYNEKGEWARAKRVLDGATAVIDRAPLDIQLEMHAALGRALSKGGLGEGPASAAYAKVRALWTNPAADAAKIRDAYPSEDDEQRTRRVTHALSAVGEAYFYAAEEQRRSQVDALKFPTYHGSGTKEDVLRHVQTKILVWFNKKRAAIESVDTEYQKVRDLQPAAPPAWVIAAGSRTGLLWGTFVNEFRSAPIPNEWKRDPELFGIYMDALVKASEPLKMNRALPALQKCLDLSVRYQYFDSFSRACEVWLSANYGTQYHLVDELRGAPSLADTGLEVRTPPLPYVRRVAAN